MTKAEQYRADQIAETRTRLLRGDLRDDLQNYMLDCELVDQVLSMATRDGMSKTELGEEIARLISDHADRLAEEIVSATHQPREDDFE